MRSARDKEGNRQIPVSGKEREETTKQETRDWEKQTGFGQGQHDWESVKGIGDQRPDYQREGISQREGFGQSQGGKTGYGQDHQQEGRSGLQTAGMGGGGSWSSDKGTSQLQSETGKTREWDQDQQMEKGYEQQSDTGQKSHEWKQKLQQQPEQYGESSYQQQKPYQELEKPRRIGFEEQPEQGRGRRIELDDTEQQGKGRRVGIDDHSSHSDRGRSAEQLEKQAGQENQETCARNEPCSATGVCPKEKEQEPCPQKQPCSTHSKKEGQHKGDEEAAAAGTGGGILQRLGLKKKEGEDEGREAKDEEHQQQGRMNPKLKGEIMQRKDKRFTNIMTTMQKTKCKALLDSHSPLVTVSDTTSVNEALVTLIEHDLSSAPIISQDKGEFIGFIDMLGLTKFTMSLQGKQQPLQGRLQQQPLQGRLQQQQQQQQKQQKQPSLARSEEWKNETVGGLLKKNIICADHHQLLGTSTLYEAFELMARSRHHRIALTGKRNEVIGVLTQSMLMEWLYDNKKDLGDVADILVLRVRPYTFLATVKNDEPAFHAFDLMAKQHLSGLAVVDRDGRLVDGISVRDLRGVCSGSGCDFSPLSKSTQQFKEIVGKAKAEFKWTGKLIVKNEDNFATVLEKLVKQRAHRVFVIDREGKPVDVITGSSIMMMLLHCAFPPEHWGPLT